MNIEVMATSAVKTALAKTDFLSTYSVNEADKEPMWDGYIYMYSDKNYANKAFVDRVPTQIKGKQVKNFGGKKIKFSIEKLKLEKYFNDGGIIFFAVQMDGNGVTKVYYSSLLPYDIRVILCGNKKKKASSMISIEFTEFPEREFKICKIFEQFIFHRKKQLGIVSKDKLLSPDDVIELKEKGHIESFHMFKSFPLDLSNVQPTNYLYVKYINGTYEPFSTIDVASTTKVIQTTLEIEIDGETRCFRAEISKKNINSGGFDTIIENSLIFESLNEGVKVRFIDETEVSLIKRIQLLEFLVASMKGTEVKLGDEFISLLDGIEKDDIALFESSLNQLKKAKMALESIGVKQDLYLDRLDEKGSKNLDVLVEYFVDRKSLKNGIANNTVLPYKMDIGNLEVLLVLENKEGNISISNFFDKNLKVAIAKVHPASQFLVLGIDDFKKVSNIDYEKIYNDLVSFSGEAYLSHVNKLLLSSLNAYDEIKNNELLIFANRISSWLITQENKTMHIINNFQVKKRLDSLTDEDKFNIIELTESNDLDNLSSFACNVIIGNGLNSKFFYNKLSKDEQEHIMKFPIWHLYEGLKVD